MREMISIQILEISAEPSWVACVETGFDVVDAIDKIISPNCQAIKCRTQASDA